jgi:hypothetical protein
LAAGGSELNVTHSDEPLVKVAQLLKKVPKINKTAKALPNATKYFIFIPTYC